METTIKPIELTEQQRAAVAKAVMAFAMECSASGQVRQNVYKNAASAAGVEYDHEHDDWSLEGEAGYQDSPNMRWEITVQAIAGGAA